MGAAHLGFGRGDLRGDFLGRLFQGLADFAGLEFELRLLIGNVVGPFLDRVLALFRFEVFRFGFLLGLFLDLGLGRDGLRDLVAGFLESRRFVARGAECRGEGLQLFGSRQFALGGGFEVAVVERHPSQFHLGDEPTTATGDFGGVVAFFLFGGEPAAEDHRLLQEVGHIGAEVALSIGLFFAVVGRFLSGTRLVLTRGARTERLQMEVELFFRLAVEFLGGVVERFEGVEVAEEVAQLADDLFVLVVGGALLLGGRFGVRGGRGGVEMRQDRLHLILGQIREILGDFAEERLFLLGGDVLIRQDAKRGGDAAGGFFDVGDGFLLLLLLGGGVEFGRAQRGYRRDSECGREERCGQLAEGHEITSEEPRCGGRGST